MTIQKLKGYGKWVILGLAILVVASLVVGGKREPGLPRLCFGEKACLKVEIADNDEKRQQGLSGREGLAEDEGMLFVFDKPQKLTFWMKQMMFGLDFIWLREGRVIEITEDVGKPETVEEERQLIQPKELMDQVLEVNQGWVARHTIEVGDKMSVSNYLISKNLR